MKITFDNNNTNQNVDKVMTTTYRNTHTEKTNQTSVFALDISGTVMDNTAYKGQGKTAEEVMQDAGQIDLAVQKDYLTVMSNSVSTEDFSRMMKDGYHIGDMEVEEVVTIVDKIKAELIKGGTQVAGYTDQIDAETLEAITGSEAFARQLCEQFAEKDVPVTEENVKDAVKAYNKAEELEELTEGAVKYMVENHMEPTIDNLYLADYSSTADGDRQGRGYYADGPGYYAKKAEEFNWQQLQPQMEKVLEEAGLEVNEQTLQSAKWLLEKGIPLTPETAADLYRLDNLTFPQDEKQVLSAIAAAIADGKRAGEADLSDGRSNLEKAAEYVERFENISDEAVDKTVADGKELTLENLEAAQKQIIDTGASYESDNAGPEKNVANDTANSEQNVVVDAINLEQDAVNYDTMAGSAENITARRRLEEIRLMMTIEANMKLLESGYSIDTTELENLVEALKQIETQQRQLLFGEPDLERAAEKAALYTETRNKVEEIPYLPIDIAGRFKVTDEDFTLNQVHVEGSALRNGYDEAKERYETWMTPRADMGDSIRKAFRNVDAILEDMGLETSEENRRAVRILSYNKMELSDESIQAVKASDMELHRVIDKMTPAMVLQTIRDGKNPLEMTIPELNDYLDSTQYASEQENEKYSRFLYKLDRNKEIDQEERAAFIGIYRMFRQFEKTDDAAVGALVNMGAELSFKNLLSAVRSQKKVGMDFSIDDAFAGIDVIEKTMSITGQIESGFSKYYRDVVADIADRMAEQDDAAEADYQAEQLQDMRESYEVEDSVIEELLHSRQPVTENNLLAANMLMNRPGFLYKKLDDLTKLADKDKVKDAVIHLTDSMTDKDSAQKAYNEMQNTYEDILEDAQYDANINFIDLKAIQSCRKQLTLARGLAQEENYHIPVEINGETTSIHLKVLHNEEDGGKVRATLNTESYGKVAAEFSIRNNKLSGYIACSTPEGVNEVQSRNESLQIGFRDTVESLKQNKLELGKIGVIHSNDLDLNAFTAEGNDEASPVQTADLYQVAKAFITVITG
ncbi:MAG: hypothetical protein J1E98_07635 [Lachnospiraceae bacterium]|nr:hypothetical protein [Lachnospiraceae bacterium]